MLQPVLAVVQRKLGRCARCMRLSLRGAVAGWAAVVLGHFAPVNTYMADLAVLWACSFTALWLAHAAAFAARTAAMTRVTFVSSSNEPATADAVPMLQSATSAAPRQLPRRDVLKAYFTGTLAAALVSASLPLTALAKGTCGASLCCCSEKCAAGFTPGDCDCCDQGCCPQGFPYACYSLRKCYSSIDAAKAACGDGLEFCDEG